MVHVRNHISIPRRRSSPFFDLDGEMLHASSVCPREDLTRLLYFVPKGWACRTRGRKFGVYAPKTEWIFGLLCLKMSKIRYVKLDFRVGYIFFVTMCLILITGSSGLRCFSENFDRHALEYVYLDHAKFTAVFLFTAPWKNLSNY